MYHDNKAVPSPSVAKLSSASAMTHASDKDKDLKMIEMIRTRGKKDEQKCLSASGNKKCACHKKTTGVDVWEIDD